MTNRFHSSK